MPLDLYNRPHIRTITPNDRFVVRTGRGIKLEDRVVPEGDELPCGALPFYILQCLYRQGRIDVVRS